MRAVESDNIIKFQEEIIRMVSQKVSQLVKVTLTMAMDMVVSGLVPKHCG